MTCLPAALRRPFSIALFVVAAVTGPASSLLAQPMQMVQSIPDPNDPVERLGRYIRILAGSPRDLDALLGAGQAALDVGDANAALGFFARAEDVSPSNGRVKAGLGSSLVMIERPDDALRLFAEAMSMGVPESAIARDRGLAYDLRGDSKRAQRDYALAMTRGRDDELVRRYALSLGISGDRTGAMALLDPLLRKQDQGSWRARSFIMAMNGDVSGANAVARQLMVPAMANAMAPLLSRLGGLNAAERAHAVNFGTVPTDGTQLAVQTGDPFLGAMPRAPVVSSDAGLIPAGEPLGPRPVDMKPTRVAMADSREPRRRPGQDVLAPVPVTAPSTAPSTAPPTVPKPAPGFTLENRETTALGRRIGDRIGPIDPARLPPEARGESFQVTRVANGVLPPPDGVRPLVGPPAVATSVLTSPAVLPTPAPPASTQVVVEQVALSAVPVATPPAVATPVADSLAQPVPTSSVVAPVKRLAGLLDGIEREAETTVALPNAAELRRARAAARKKMEQLAAQTAAEEADKREKAEKAAAAKRNPARVWVQIATGRNDAGLGITLKRIRSDNETALKGLSGWSAPFKATNRVLVGPMKSSAAARELVGKLAKNGVSAMTYSSDAGEEVEKIGAR